MGHFVGKGNVTLYVDDNGVFWDNEFRGRRIGAKELAEYGIKTGAVKKEKKPEKEEEPVKDPDVKENYLDRLTQPETPEFDEEDVELAKKLIREGMLSINMFVANKPGCNTGAKERARIKKVINHVVDMYEGRVRLHNGRYKLMRMR